MTTLNENIPVPDPDNIKLHEGTKPNSTDLIKFAKKLSKKYRVIGDKKFDLDDYPKDASSDLGKDGNELAQQILVLSVKALAEMQDKLYAHDKWSLLVIFQAMDAAGKDGAINHVMSGVNPQGCEVTSFKSPNSEELDHDYLWRCMKNLPSRGKIGIFNRSYYEEVLVVRVHEAILKSQKLPEELITEDIWKERLNDIQNFETYLNNNGTLVVKIFLHVSKKEQKRRFLERIETPEKNWKFSKSDLVERQYWKEYMDAYEHLIRRTASEKSPWYIVPADNKHYARIIVASAILEALDSMNLAYPTVSKEQVAELQRLKKQLLDEE
jgi:PPK2 family polyphosphate:nucleotide phosphotransferase